MKNISSGKKGFTLLELIVVIAIVGIITAVSWGALSGAKKNSSALNACEQVAAMINKTRNYVISGRVSSSSFRITGTTTAAISNPAETFIFSDGVLCDNVDLTYIAPNAIGSSANINCTGAGVTRTVNVTPYQAICQ